MRLKPEVYRAVLVTSLCWSVFYVGVIYYYLSSPSANVERLEFMKLLFNFEFVVGNMSGIRDFLPVTTATN
jgi:hypothetical protein